jgi:type IV secretory pathway VirB3-like protein
MFVILCVVFVILCYCVCNFVCCVLLLVCVCVILFLCIVVPLPPGTYPLSVNNNNNNNKFMSRRRQAGQDPQSVWTGYEPWIFQSVS